MKNKMNKCGTDKILSVYWFTILFIVASAIVYMTISFYGEPYDVRELEANALANKVADCFSESGYLKRDPLGNEDFKNDFLEACNLNLDVENIHNWREQGQYYLGVELFQDGAPVFEVSEGNKNLISSCGVEKEVEKERLAKCVEREFFALDPIGNVHSIKILSIVRKTEKNAKQ